MRNANEWQTGGVDASPFALRNPHVGWGPWSTSLRAAGGLVDEVFKSARLEPRYLSLCRVPQGPVMVPCKSRNRMTWDQVKTIKSRYVCVCVCLVYVWILVPIWSREQFVSCSATAAYLIPSYLFAHPTTLAPYPQSWSAVSSPNKEKEARGLCR